jgi:hypothetical protein
LRLINADRQQALAATFPPECQDQNKDQ